MDRATISKAVELYSSIQALERIINDVEERKWIKVIGASGAEWKPKESIQREFCAWLKAKREALEIELFEL